MTLWRVNGGKAKVNDTPIMYSSRSPWQRASTLRS